MKPTTAITTVKGDVKLQEWMEQIKAQQESGMTVTAYCAQNGSILRLIIIIFAKFGSSVWNQNRQ